VCKSADADICTLPQNRLLKCGIKCDVCLELSCIRKCGYNAVVWGGMVNTNDNNNLDTHTWRMLQVRMHIITTTTTTEQKTYKSVTSKFSVN
jgi:hypothetical protein